VDGEALGARRGLAQFAAMNGGARESMSSKRLGVKPHADGFLEGDTRPFEARSVRIQVAGVVDDQPVGAPDVVDATLRIRNRRAKLLYFRHQAGRREYLSKLLPVHCHPSLLRHRYRRSMPAL